MRPVWGDGAGADPLAAQRLCSARQRGGARPPCGNPPHPRVLRSTTSQSRSATVIAQHGGERQRFELLSISTSQGGLRRQRPISASEACFVRAAVLPLPPPPISSPAFAGLQVRTGPIRIRSVGSACSISGSIGSMSTSSVHSGFGLLRSAASLRSPLGSARGSLSLPHASALVRASLLTPGGSAPSCPLPSRPRQAGSPAIPTWEELLGQR